MLPALRSRTAAVLLVIIMLASAACSARGPQPSATATPTPRERLDAASKRMQALTAFHFLLTHQNGVSTIADNLLMSRAEGDYASPDRIKAAVKASFQGLPVSVTVISIGDQSWITNPLQTGEHYQPLPNGPQTAAILDPSTGLLKAANQMTNPRLTGTDKIGGVATYVVAGNVDAGNLTPIATGAESGRAVPTQIWIGETDSLIYRVRLNGPLSSSEPKNIVREIDLSQFNEQIDIQPPSS